VASASTRHYTHQKTPSHQPTISPGHQVGLTGVARASREPRARCACHIQTESVRYRGSPRHRSGFSTGVARFPGSRLLVARSGGLRPGFVLASAPRTNPVAMRTLTVNPLPVGEENSPSLHVSGWNSAHLASVRTSARCAEPGYKSLIRNFDHRCM
jgi:hypothetical protein